MKNNIIFLLAFILLLSTVSAFEFDNVKHYDSETETITIKNCNLWAIVCLIEGATLAEYTLTENTEQCLFGCHAEGTADLRNDGVLFDGVEFKNRDGDTKQINDFKYFIEVEDREDVVVPTYEVVCSDENVNATIECTQVQNGTYVREKVSYSWKRYFGTELSTGNYNWRIEGKKNKGQSVDWILSTTYGFNLDEWAWWNSTWTKKRLINLTSDVGNFSYIGNISFDADMNVDFSDIRFLDNQTETLELNYTIESKVNSSHAVVRVFSQGNSSFYMYYGNPSASSAGSASDTHFNPVAYYYFDDLAGVVTDALGVNNGTNNGATRGVDGQINNSFDFTPEDYVDSNVDVSGQTDFSVQAWVNFDVAGGTVIGNDAGGFDQSFRINVNVGEISINVQDGASTQLSIDSGVAISTGTWYHTVYTKDGTNHSIYVDGIHRNSQTLSQTPNSNDLFIGGRNDRGSPASIDGKIDEVAIYNYDLSDSQIKHLATYTEPTYTIGEEQVESGISVTLNSPINNVSINNSVVNFNWTITPTSVNITNWTLNVWFDNGTLAHQHINTTIDTDETVTIIHNHTLFIDEDYIWTVESCSNIDDCNTASNETFSLDTAPPIVNITYPLDGFVVTELQQNITVNYTVIHPVGVLDVCWLITSENATLNFINCTTNTTSILYPSDNPDNLTIFVFANDSVGNIGSDNVTIIKNTIAPTVNITSPIDFFNVTEFNQSIELNWTVETNGTLDSCWYQFPDNEKGSSESCYQESANISDQSGTDGSCGQNYDGVYFTTTNLNSWFPSYSSIWDGNWTSSASYNLVFADVNYFTNYTKPSQTATGASINVSFNGTANITLQTPKSCFDSSDTIQVWYLLREAAQTTISCFNGTSWVEMFDGGSGRVIYEEGITWKFERTFVNCSDNTTIINYPISNPDNVTVLFFANDTLGNLGFDNVTLLKDVTVPQIEVEAPNGTLGFNFVGGNETLNVTFTDSGLDSCWYNYNGTNVTIDGCITGVKNSTFFVLEEDNLNMTIYANDSFSNINSTFITWDYTALQLNQTYEESVTEGETNDFFILLDVLDGSSLDSATFSYNGTNYTTSVIFSSGLYLVSSSITAPLVDNDTNFTFNFHIVVDSVGYTTELTNQTVLNSLFDICGGISNDTLLNMSLFDEGTILSLSGDIEISASIVSKSSGITIGAVNSTFESVKYGAICFSPTSDYPLYYLDAEIRYESDGYAAEFYHIQQSDMADYPVNLSLYDLNLNDSTEFDITYKNNAFIFTEGAVIQLQRKYIGENVYRVVEAPLTGNGGEAVLHIDLNTNKYRISVVKDGELLDLFDNIVFSCANELSGECTHNLDGTVNPNNDIPIETITDFSYSISIDEDNQTITVLFAVPSGTPSTINVLLNQIDMFGNSTACNTTVITSAGSITCGYNDTIEKSIIELSISKNNVQLGVTNYVNDPELDMDGMNFFIIFLFTISLVGMAIASPEWMIMISVMTLIISGTLLLVKGMSLVIGLGAIAWLVVAAAIIIFKIAKQEDK